MRMLLLALVLVVASAGCGSWWPGGRGGGEGIDLGPVHFTGDHVRALRLTRSLSVSEETGSHRPGPPTSTFTLEDEIFLFVVLAWGEIDQKGRLAPTWKWYANGELFDVVDGPKLEVVSPYNFWGSYTAFSLGVGSHEVELWVDRERLASARFDVVADEVIEVVEEAAE